MQDNIYKKAIEKRGKKQIHKAIEELIELIQALWKSLENQDINRLSNRDSVIEEIVDVLIMIRQMREYYFITQAEIEECKEIKLEKLNKLLEGQEVGIIKKSECLQALKYFTQTEGQADE